jgi:hypothetical protein
MTEILKIQKSCVRWDVTTVTTGLHELHRELQRSPNKRDLVVSCGKYQENFGIS